MLARSGSVGKRGMAASPRPFTLSVPDEAIADLRARLALTRFPDQAPDAPWAYGTDLDYMKALVPYWREQFDWRAQEAALNAFPQFKVQMDDVDLHYLHVPGKGPAPFPLLLMHGWPGSVYEFLDIIPRLTDPARFGGDAADAFTVIAPSLPGYGLSFAPGQKRFSIEAIADCFAGLMSEVLGFRRYGAQGGDYGAFTASRLGHVRAAGLVGIHVNLLTVPRDRPPPAEADGGGASLLRGTGGVAEGGDGLSVDSGDEAADAGVWADGFSGGVAGVDCREVQDLDGLRR